jgi:hypothetical protein
MMRRGQAPSFEAPSASWDQEVERDCVTEEVSDVFNKNI